MKLLRSLIHPLFAMIAIQLAWIIVVLSWIYWFLGTQKRLRNLAQQYRPELLNTSTDWIIMVEGLVLLVMILAGVYVIFLYWNRQRSLLKEQKNFISQVTHELKSPLASIQLHLETIQLRHPEPGKLDSFVETMLEDTSRLHSLISNLLTASRFEQRGLKLSLRRIDLSRFTHSYFEGQRSSLPPQSRMDLEISPGIWANVETESLSIVFRNLLENAVLYSPSPPTLKIELFSQGGACHLRFCDQGRGISEPDRKKIFRMFYRVRRGGETIQGTGLGLFIVRAIVLRHKGKVSVESEGENKGTTFHIQLPMAQEAQ